MINYLLWLQHTKILMYILIVTLHHCTCEYIPLISARRFQSTISFPNVHTTSYAYFLLRSSYQHFCMHYFLLPFISVTISTFLYFQRILYNTGYEYFSTLKQEMYGRGQQKATIPAWLNSFLHTHIHMYLLRCIKRV